MNVNNKYNQPIASVASFCNESIDLIVNNSNLSPEAFCLVGRKFDLNGIFEIQKNSKIKELFLKAKHSLFGGGELHKQQLAHAIENNVKFLNLHKDRVGHVTDEESYTDNFLSAQRYNHFVQMAQDTDEIKSNIPLFKELQLTQLNTFERALPITINGSVTSIPMDKIPDNQQPHILHEGFWHKHKLYHYNEADLHLSHHTDAAKILLSTHTERLMSKIGKVVEFIAESVFGYKITYFSAYHYFKNDEDKKDEVYAKDLPLGVTDKGSSYFVGHATCLINVPVKTEQGEPIHVNIITDPVEGDLNKIFYPRMTDPARLIDDCPVPHVFLLSHNHLDHYDHNTLVKLIKYQPVMLVPEGDKDKFTKLGFTNVFENNWWSTTTIPVEQNGRSGELKITTVPANHWSGQQGPCDGHRAAFVGYVIHKEEGDIYFAGDTARLTDDHLTTLRNRFNIRTMFQPGGPDECRENMKGTHQSSVDAVWMHFELMMQNLYVKGDFQNRSKTEFIEEAKNLRTIYMHNKTFKLGNLHFDDTDASIARLYNGIQSEINEDIDLSDLREHEWNVLNELKDYWIDNAEKKQLIFKKVNELVVGELELTHEPLDATDILEILKATIVVPKIGSRTDFAS